MALRNNYKIRIATQENIAAQHSHKAALTNNLPRIEASALYMHSQRSISLINHKQERALRTMGTTLQQANTNILEQLTNALPELAPILSLLQNTDIFTQLNEIGNSIANTLCPDTRNIYAATVTVTQPIYTGGKISAYKKITEYLENITANNIESVRQSTIEATEQTYWLIVSLANKEQLAHSYLELINELHKNVEELQRQGMATKSQLLSVDVSLNEARSQLLRAQNATLLARMLLNTICALPQDCTLTLADEKNIQCRQLDQTAIKENIPTATNISDSIAIDNNPEFQNLKLATSISHQETKLVRADYLPQLGLSVSYMTSNPSLTDGFQNKFGDTWNIGIELKIPLWSWNERAHKIKASRAKEHIAQYTLDDSRRMLLLLIEQSRRRISEAEATLSIAISNVDVADENLRTARIAFDEGLLNSDEFMAAHTVWLKAHTAHIDAKIEIIMSEIRLKKALGILK